MALCHDPRLKTMDLREWCYRRPARYGDVATATGKSVFTIRQYAKGARRFPATLAAIEALEKLTNGDVTRHDVRSDVFGPHPEPKARKPRAPRVPPCIGHAVASDAVEAGNDNSTPVGLPTV